MGKACVRDHLRDMGAKVWIMDDGTIYYEFKGHCDTIDKNASYEDIKGELNRAAERAGE